MPEYTVNAYFYPNRTKLMDSLDTDYLNEVEDFIKRNVQKGYNCRFKHNVSGEERWVYAESFTENTIDYADLLMEQQEQM